MKKYKNYICFFLLIFFSTSCIQTAIVGSATGINLAVQERKIVDTKDDVIIATKLAKEFILNGLKSLGNSIDATVYEGRVLLTGIARDQDKAKMAQEISWKIKDVREVIDEIEIRQDENIKIKDISTATSDYIITAKLETKLLFTRNISSANYKITTVNKVVYVMGVASNNNEMTSVLSVIAKTSGVEKVINHALLKDDERRKK